MTLKSKKRETNSKYNPALDKFSDIDAFPKKTQAAREHLKDRDIRNEIKALKENEKFTNT